MVELLVRQVVRETTVGKAIIFGAARGLFGHTKLTENVSVLRRIFASQPRLSDPLIFVSALTGLPPFYAVSIAAGGLRLSLRRFLAAGFVGRAIRFGALALTVQSAIGVLL